MQLSEIKAAKTITLALHQRDSQVMSARRATGLSNSSDEDRSIALEGCASNLFTAMV